MNRVSKFAASRQVIYPALAREAYQSYHPVATKLPYVAAETSALPTLYSARY